MKTTLAARLKQPGILTLPGIHDLVSARLAEATGFEAIYMSGYGVVASGLGLPDAGLATFPTCSTECVASPKP